MSPPLPLLLLLRTNHEFSHATAVPLTVRNVPPSSAQRGRTCETSRPAGRPTAEGKATTPPETDRNSAPRATVCKEEDGS